MDGQYWTDFKEIAVNMRNWIDSVLDRDYWRAAVKPVLNLRVPEPMYLAYYLSESDETMLNVYDIKILQNI